MRRKSERNERFANVFFFFFFFFEIFQVCEDNKCQEEVFILALNYMDRFLALTPVGKRQLQILASACLLLASKLREPSVRGLPADLLVHYTDNSITTKDLIVSTTTPLTMNIVFIYTNLAHRNLQFYILTLECDIFMCLNLKKKRIRTSAHWI